ncbi:hypothetical protein QP257_25720, partial [Escherichia coli]|nr:hypothetical protein [Escherichia coli]
FFTDILQKVQNILQKRKTLAKAYNWEAFLNKEPKLLKEPREGVPEVIDTLEAYKEYCNLLSAGSGPLAADAERASG